MKELEVITKRNLTVFTRNHEGPLKIEHTLDDFFEEEDVHEDVEEEEDVDEEEDFDNLFSEDELISAEVGLNKEKDQERIKELAREHERPLPSEMLPSAFSACALFFTITSHILFHLLCHWMARFRAWALFSKLSPTSEVRPGHYVLCVTHKHRGKSDMIKLRRSDDGRIFFEFQRLMYQYATNKDLKTNPELGDAELIGSDKTSGAIRVVRCPIDMPLKFYTMTSRRGLTSVQAEQSQRKYV